MHSLPSRQGLDGRPPLPTSAVDATGVLRHSLNVLEKDMSVPLATLFQRVTQGVYVVGVAHGEVRNAFTAAWVMQVSFEPLLLALSINPHHSSYGLLKEARAFSVNVLKKDQLEAAAKYGRPAGPDKLALKEWTPGRMGVPLLLESLAWFECQVVGEHAAG